MSFSDPRLGKKNSENIDNNGYDSQRDFDSNTLKYSNISQENKLSAFFDANNLDSGDRYQSNEKNHYDIKNDEEFENLQFESENYKVYVNNDDYSHDFNLNQDYDNNTFSNKKEKILEKKNETLPNLEHEENNERFLDKNNYKPPFHRPPPPRNQGNNQIKCPNSNPEKLGNIISNDANFDKLKNSKLFQKFLKEENLGKESKSLISENKKLIETKKSFSLLPQQKNISFPKENNNQYEGEKELAGFSQIVPGNTYIPNQFMNKPSLYNQNNHNNYGQIDPNFLNYNSNMYDFTNMTEEQIFNKQKVVELTDLLSKEIEKTQLLERKCLDYMNHIDRLTKNYEEIKYRLLENEDYRHKIYECENCAQRIENTESYLTELETLKKKINQEAQMKNKLEDEVKDLNRYIIQLQDNITEKDAQIERNIEENIEIRKNLESLKTENFTNKSAKFKFEEKIKEMENEFLNMRNDYEFEKKQLYELKERIKTLEIDKERLKNENLSLKNSMNTHLIENESLKNENYNIKQDLQEKTQNQMQFTLMIEKANMETNQFKVLLSRTEKNLADQKEQNQSLIKKLSELAKENSDRHNHKNMTPVKNSSKLDNFQNTHIESGKKSLANHEDSERAFENKKWNHLAKGINEQYEYSNNYQNHTHFMKNQNNKTSFINNDYEIKQEWPTNSNKNKISESDLNLNKNNAPYFKKEYLLNDSTHHPAKTLNKNNISTNFLEWNEPPPKRINEKEKDSAEAFHNLKNKNEILLNDVKNEKFLQEYSPKKKELAPPRPRDLQDRSLNYEKRLQEKALPPRRNEPNSSSIQIKKEEETKNFARDDSNNKKKIENENLIQTIKNVEKNLMLAQIQKEKMEAELRKIEEAKMKTAMSIKRKGELEEEMKILAGNITQLKTKLREMNALHSY